MKKALTIVGLFIGINATAQVATSGTTNSGTNASAIGYQSSATNTVSTAIGRETLASGINSSRVMSFFIFLNLTQFLVQSK